MRSPTLVALLLAGLACDASGPPLASWAGARTLEAVPVEEARQRLASAEAQLIQVREANDRLPIVPGAWVVRPGEPLPEVAGPLLVVAVREEAALRRAADLSRAGRRVGVVVGDPAGLLETRRATHRSGESGRNASGTTGILDPH